MTTVEPVVGDNTARGEALPTRRARRSWSDFAGSAAFIAIAVWLAASAPLLSLAVFPGFAYELSFALAFLTRAPARATLPGLWPRIAALVGTFIIPITMAVGTAVAPQSVAGVAHVAPFVMRWIVAAGAFLTLAGIIVSLWGLWYLRRSVSLVPAARALVTTGPYAIARHPLYLAYILTYGGFTLLHPTPVVIAAMLVWLVATIARVRYEERILSAAFPEYREYRERVGAFGPKLRALA